MCYIAVVVVFDGDVVVMAVIIVDVINAVGVSDVLLYKHFSHSS